MPWWIGTIAGSISLAILNALSRGYDVTLWNWRLIIIPLLVCQWGYWYGFYNAPNFIKCWYTGSALNAISAIALSLLFFDKSISPSTVIGIVLIISGQWVLAVR